MTASGVAQWWSRLREQTFRRRGQAQPAHPRPALDLPAPLTAERVARQLTDRQFNFVLDEDGDISGSWDGNRFWFLLLGDEREALQVRGRWHRTLPLARRASTIVAANDWNRERIWPKVYVRTEGEELALYCEIAADLEHGVTDAQLAQLLACGLGTGLQVFSTMDKALPEPS